MHYVCSDIHGQFALYQKLLTDIRFSETDTLYILGDVIDKGHHGIDILRDIMQRPNVELFLGNHELMMLDYLDGNKNKNIWFYANNGGQNTWEQFHHLTEKEQHAIIRYLKNIWIQKYVTVGHIRYALSHSYFLPEKTGKNVRYCEETNEQAVFDAVWNSPYRFWEYVAPDCYENDCIHIFGHVPVQSEGLQKPPLIHKRNDKLIDIDGGCALISFHENGGLFAMTLETDKTGKRNEYWITDP